MDAAPAGAPAGHTRNPRSARRAFGLAVGVTAALVTASCAGSYIATVTSSRLA